MSLNLNLAHTENLCKFGKGFETCKYLIFGMGGFQCAKDNPENKKSIDDNWASNPHVAQGDNCVGYDNFQKEKGMDASSKEPSEWALNVSKSEVENGTVNRNQNDKRYEDPFEDESAPDDDFIDED